MRTRIALQKSAVRSSSSDRFHCAKAFGVREVPASLLLLPLRLLQLLPDLVFFVANVLQVTLEERQLRCFRIRVVPQRLIVLATPVRGPGFLRFADLEKQV